MKNTKESSNPRKQFGRYNAVSLLYTVRHNYQPPSFKRHNSVNIRFIYKKISDNVADGMLSLQI